MQVFLVSLLRRNDQVEQSVVQILLHLRIFPEFNDQVERQRRNVFFQRVLKCFKAHSHADRGSFRL
ncbi:hypothetical protein D3C86_1684730 [compost metagenome]